MAELKTQKMGLRCNLSRGSAVFGVLSETGEYVCYSLTSTEGVKTNFALSDEALSAMVAIRTKLRTSIGDTPAPQSKDGGEGIRYSSWCDKHSRGTPCDKCATHGVKASRPMQPTPYGLAGIEGDAIVIRLTADACAFAFANDPQAQEPRPPVIDKQQFLRDTLNELTAEREDGSTPLTDMLDRAMVKAMENGSDALDHDATDGMSPSAPSGDTEGGA